MIGRTQITGVVLAGGRGTRMGGVDKGLQPYRGQPLAWHALQRLQSQTGTCLINANRHPEQYAAWGAAVLADDLPDHPGPLAGVAVALAHCRTPWLVTVPCDCPLFPEDLVARLASALDAAGGDLAVAAVAAPGAAGGVRLQPVFCLMQVRLLPDLQAFLAGGGRKVEDWIRRLAHVPVVFPDAAAFVNVNTMAELQALQHPRLAEVTARQPGYDPDNLPADAVQQVLAQFVAPVRAQEVVGIFDALGRVLAQDIVSPISVPPHDNAAMDGFAFDGAALAPDAPLRLRVVGQVRAGDVWTGALEPGQAVRITTGAMMPAGLDTVIPHELAAADGDGLTIPAGLLQRGDNRRCRGEDLLQGTAALRQGERLGPAALGLIASLGIGAVPVVRRLRVAFFSTGSEIVSLGEPARAGAVYDSNRYTLFGLLRRLGVEVLDRGAVRDDPAALEAAFLDAAQQADAIITSGGVGVGEADFTQEIMRRLCGHPDQIAFWRIAMRPGRPMAVGRISAATAAGRASAVLFGLPGNPVAVMVTFLAFVRPALLRMMGARPEPTPLLRARSTQALRKKPGRTEYQRGRVETDASGQLQVTPSGHQGSGVLRSMVEANGLIVLHHDQGEVAAGDEVAVMMFDGVI